VFPLTGFDVSPFCEMEGKKDAKDTVYDLLAVINHRGGLGGEVHHLNDLLMLNFKEDIM
jgi:hypothetical protein